MRRPAIVGRKDRGTWFPPSYSGIQGCPAADVIGRLTTAIPGKPTAGPCWEGGCWQSEAWRTEAYCVSKDTICVISDDAPNNPHHMPENKKRLRGAHI